MLFWHKIRVQVIVESVDSIRPLHRNFVLRSQNFDESKTLNTKR
jgi:hypothetical protein